MHLFWNYKKRINCCFQAGQINISPSQLIVYATMVCFHSSLFIFYYPLHDTVMFHVHGLHCGSCQVCWLPMFFLANWDSNNGLILGLYMIVCCTSVAVCSTSGGWTPEGDQNGAGNLRKVYEKCFKVWILRKCLCYEWWSFLSTISL